MGLTPPKTKRNICPAVRAGLGYVPRSALGAGGKGCQGLFAAPVNREDAVESGDLEDLADVLVGADDRQRTAGRAQALDAADKDAQCRRVDECGLRQVDHDLLLALLDDL